MGEAGLPIINTHVPNNSGLLPETIKTISYSLQGRLVCIFAHA